MAYEHRDGSGALFRNDKQGVEKRPDYRGDLMLDGKLWEVSGWLKDGAKGKWMSLAAKPKEAREGQRQSAPKAAPEPEDFADSDIPF